MKVDYKKIILSSILWTLTAIILLYAIATMIFVLAFPKTLGNFLGSIGSDKLASTMYYRAYKKDGDINLCYKALSIQIKLDNDKKVKEYYEAFENDDNYENFMFALVETVEKSSFEILEKSTLLVEKNYLAGRYVASLIDLGEKSRAYTFAINNFKNYQNITFKDLGIYCINQFIDLDEFNDFDQIPEGYTMALIDCMQNYFNESVELFEINKSPKNELDSSYLMALGNRIIVVGQNINKINANNNKHNNIDNINTTLTNVNNVIKGLL